MGDNREYKYEICLDDFRTIEGSPLLASRRYTVGGMIIENFKFELYFDVFYPPLGST